MPSRRHLVFALCVLAIALGVGASALLLATRNDGSGSGTALVGGPFTMTDQTGKRVTEKDFLGHYSLLFFGYTFCPDVCPSELQTMTAALEQMGPAADGITPVFVSIDPERDTPDVVKSYVENFHPRMIGLTGSADDVAKMASTYRVFYGKAKGTEATKDYLMDHSAILYLMGPDGRFVKHFTYSTDAKALADGLKAAVGR